MSELKATSSGEIRARNTLLGYWWYEKSEADKVIAEKDAEIAELKAESERLRGESCKLTDGCLRLKQCRKEKANIADELRHSNRKRCLAEAKVCLLRHQRYERYLSYRASCVGLPTFERWRFLKKHYEKWYKQWLALAEEPTWAKFLKLIHKEVK